MKKQPIYFIGFFLSVIVIVWINDFGDVGYICAYFILTPLAGWLIWKALKKE